MFTGKTNQTTKSHKKKKMMNNIASMNVTNQQSADSTVHSNLLNLYSIKMEDNSREMMTQDQFSPQAVNDAH